MNIAFHIPISMKTLIPLFFAGALYSQTTTTPVSSTSTTAAETAATANASTLPTSTAKNFAEMVTVGTSWTQNAVPQAGNGVIGVWLELGTDSGTYSVSHLQITQKFSTVDTGFAKLFAKAGNFTMGALASAGVSMANPVIGNFSGGGFGKYDFTKTFLKGSSLVGEVCISAVSATTAVVPNQVTPRIILSWAKVF